MTTCGHCYEDLHDQCELQFFMGDALTNCTCTHRKDEGEGGGGAGVREPRVPTPSAPELLQYAYI